MIKLIINFFKRRKEEKQERQQIEQQKIFWSNFFEKSVHDGKLILELYVDGKLIKGSDLTFCKLDQIINPTFEDYSVVKEILRLYIDSYGSPDLASVHSHYQNSLYLLAAVTSCSTNKTIEEWEAKYNKIHENDFKLTGSL